MSFWGNLLAWIQAPAPDTRQSVRLYGGPADGAEHLITIEPGTKALCLPLHLGKDGPATYHRYIVPDDAHGLLYAGRCQQIIHPHPEEQ
jgi:hypothetical protein